MRNLLLSTAILAGATLAGPLAAQDAAMSGDLFRGASAPDEIRASDLIGMRVYASEAATDAEYAGVQEGWDDIGEVNDIVLGRDGSAQAVLLDIGGFLGIGEREVAINMDSLRFVSDSDTAEDLNDYFLVVNASRASLEEAPDYAADAAAAVGGTDAGLAAEGTDATVDTAAAADATDAQAAADADAAANQAAAVAESSAEAGAAGTTPTDEVVTETADADAVATDPAATDPAATTAETETEMEADATAMAADDAAMASDDAAMASDDAMAASDDAAMATDDAAIVTDDATMAAEDGAMATDDAAMATADAAASEEVSEDVAAADAAAADRVPTAREGYTALGAGTMTADQLQGAAVYDANDERVGEVGQLLIDDTGTISDAVIDVGGFLGIGEKPVALPMTSLDVLQQDGGDDLRVYVSQTREELDGMETYVAE